MPHPRLTVWPMCAALFALALFPSLLTAQAPDAAEQDPMAVLQAYAGDWVCEGEWAWGGTIRARNEYETVFEGRHMRARTYVSDNGGPEYLRYETLYSYDAENEAYVYTTIVYDGSVETGTLELRDDGFHIETQRENPDGSTIGLRQFISRVDGDTYAWRVSMQRPDGAWAVVMDDQWDREPGEDG